MDTVSERKLPPGKLYVNIDGQRFKLADCTPTIKVCEQERTVKLKGKTTEFPVITYSATLVICEEMKFTRDISIQLIEQISDFYIALKFPQKNGTFLEKHFDCIIPKVINLNGEWIFDATGYINEIKPLFPELFF